MIDLYSGTPGSGKSLHTAIRLYYWLRMGKTCICNFPINLKKVRKKKTDTLPFFEVDNKDITPEFLIEFSRMHFQLKGKKVKEESIVLVIDEAQILFNARTWQQAGRSDWLSFFSQHRKYGYHIILIAQFDRMLDRQIRSVIEYEYVHRKVSNFGLKGKILSLIMGARVFVAVKVWYPMQEKVGQEFFRARKRFYSLYDTYGAFAEKTSGPGVVGPQDRLFFPAESVILDSATNPHNSLAASDNSTAAGENQGGKRNAGRIRKKSTVDSGFVQRKHEG